VKVSILLLAIAIVFSTSVWAQRGEREKTQAETVVPVKIFKGRGVARVPESRTSNSPRKLNQVEIKDLYKKLGKPAPGSLYVILTPSQPTVANRGALVFVKADIVEGGKNYAVWRPDEKASPGQRGSLSLWLWSTANRRYLIDCTVDEDAPLTNPRSWSVVGPDGVTQTWNSYVPHLVFTLDATTSGWYGFSITGINRWWLFYSCEVTNL
jgi:hypothetical protein